MNILIFKTNIKYKKDLHNLMHVMNSIPSIAFWNIDREDVDKVLRIGSTNNDTEAIRNKIRYAGYVCEELV